MTSCSSPERLQLWPQSTHLLFQPSGEAADKIVFYSVYQPGRKGGLEGREWGVLWRRNAIHIMSGTLTFQRSRNACKPQTSGKMWTPGTWQLTPINSEIRAGKCGIRNPTHNLSGTFQRTGNANQLRRSTQSYQNQNLEAITNRISIMFGRSIFHRSGNAKWWVKNAPLASQEKCKPLVGKADPPKH